MDNKKFSTEDLRSMLDTYSPEQQMEINAKIVSEGAKTLADASAQIKDCLEKLPPLVAAMQKATALHITEKSKAEIIQAGKNTGVAASKAFKETVEQTVIAAQREVRHVSFPATIGYCLFYAGFGLICTINRLDSVKLL